MAFGRIVRLARQCAAELAGHGPFHGQLLQPVRHASLFPFRPDAALLAEANRLYARLALSTAARQRERDARLMSMDAVTAAIAHEVGQPLTAVGLNASAAVAWLTGAKPDVKKALTALLAVGEARQRTFDVIRSIRATFAKEPGRATEFSLNDLVIETASLLDRELAASKISLELSLDEALPSILADRVQISACSSTSLPMRSNPCVPRQICPAASRYPRR